MREARQGAAGLSAYGSPSAGRCADADLSRPRSARGRSTRVLGRRPAARAVRSSRVVGVLAVGHRVEPQPLDHLVGDAGEQLVLAVEAPVRAVRPVGGDVALMGVHLDHPDAEPGGDLVRLRSAPARLGDTPRTATTSVVPGRAPPGRAAPTSRLRRSRRRRGGPHPTAAPRAGPASRRASCAPSRLRWASASIVGPRTTACGRSRRGRRAGRCARRRSRAAPGSGRRAAARRAARRSRPAPTRTPGAGTPAVAPPSRPPGATPSCARPDRVGEARGDQQRRQVGLASYASRIRSRNGPG